MVGVASVSPRRADATENDAEILAAAARLLGRGVAAPSIREVAREAGVGSTTVYRRFPSREVLLSHAVAAMICDGLRAAVEAARADPDPMRGLRAITDALIETTSRQDPADVALPDLVETFLSRYRDDLAEMMAAAQSQGALRPDIVRDDIDGITTVMFAGLALPRHRSGAAHRYVALLFDGLSRTDGQRLP